MLELQLHAGLTNNVQKHNLIDKEQIQRKYKNRGTTAAVEIRPVTVEFQLKWPVLAWSSLESVGH